MRNKLLRNYRNDYVDAIRYTRKGREAFALGGDNPANGLIAAINSVIAA